MKLSVQGKFFKFNDEWVAEIPHLGIRASGHNSIQCLKNLVENINQELASADIKCDVKVGDGGVFYLLAANRQGFMDFIASRAVESIGDWITVENDIIRR